jgi:hypothetical protein
MAEVITMGGSGKIMMDGGSGDGQRRRNGRRDGKVFFIRYFGTYFLGS